MNEYISKNGHSLEPPLAFRGQQRSVRYLFSDTCTFTGLFLNLTFVDLYGFFTINLLYVVLILLYKMFNKDFILGLR